MSNYLPMSIIVSCNHCSCNFGINYLASLVSDICIISVSLLPKGDTYCYLTLSLL